MTTREQDGEQMEPKNPEAAEQATTGVTHGPAAGITFGSVEDLGPELGPLVKEFAEELKENVDIMTVDPGWVCDEFLRKLAEGKDFKLSKAVSRGEAAEKKQK